MLDQLEVRRAGIAERLEEPMETYAPIEDRLAGLRAQINPDNVRHIVDTLLFYLRDHADTTPKQPSSISYVSSSRRS